MRWAGIAFFLSIISAFSAPTLLRPGMRVVPGTEEAESVLLYANPAAEAVSISGSWDGWQDPRPMVNGDASPTWTFDIRVLQLAPGRYEFKFIVDQAWEDGENRALYIDKEGAMRPPPDLLRSVYLETPNRIDVFFRGRIEIGPAARFRLEPPVEISRIEQPVQRVDSSLTGYEVEGGRVTFVFDPEVYRRQLDPETDTLAIGANFNDWNPVWGNDRWRLRRAEGERVWTLTTPLDGLHPPAGEEDLQFKFVQNQDDWLGVPAAAPNAVPDGRGNTNLQLDPSGGAVRALQLHLSEPLSLRRSHTLIVEGLADRPAWMAVSPGADLMAGWSTGKRLGAILDRPHRATHYRLFAPRATSVHLCLFNGPAYRTGPRREIVVEPVERYRMWHDSEDGVWEISTLGLDIGRYYSFQVDGPRGDGEGFSPAQQVGDPYARAAAEAGGNTLVIDPEATNQWFRGWTDEAWEPPRPEDLVIYEAHVRDLTMHPSSGVPEELRGTFAGIPASLGTGTGVDHLRELGVNAIELLPVAEFNNPGGRHDWGYATTFFFAPESSYGRSPATGAQYYEFKQMVDDLHRAGFAVILDVVFNHTGHPNLFSLIDRKYYFRLNPDLSYSNFSGVGNDCRTESPMMRRLIIDNVLYWMTEHHVDGFRFDLAELIDMETLRQLESEARALNPDVLLISEPWSFRGNHKYQLTGTGWAAWNDDFRNAAKDFVRGRPNRLQMQRVLPGSVDLWAATPLQTVNYLESHDDMTLADELSTVPGRDATTLVAADVQSNLLGATLLFTSLGMKMIAEGQEFLRSKQGVHNSYNRGDQINALNWHHRDRPLARDALAYYQGLIRLMRSPEGQAFRAIDRMPADYYRWILPPQDDALGYLVNGAHSHPGAAFVVLVNAGTDPVQFSCPLPDGNWGVIGDGRKVLVTGLPDYARYAGGVDAAILVPPRTAYILRDGF